MDYENNVKRVIPMIMLVCAALAYIDNHQNRK